MDVYWEGKVWECPMFLRENLFYELKQINPTLLIEIKRNTTIKFVQIKEVKTPSERRQI